MYQWLAIQLGCIPNHTTTRYLLHNDSSTQHKESVGMNAHPTPRRQLTAMNHSSRTLEDRLSSVLVKNQGRGFDATFKTMVSYTEVKFPSQGYLRSLPTPEKTTEEPHFIIYQDSVKDVFGDLPKLTLALEDKESLFHEAGVFFPSLDHDRLFVTSNILERSGNKQIRISLLQRDKDEASWKRSDVPEGGAVMANGAVNCPNMQSLLICAQGNYDNIGGLVRMSAQEPYQTEPVLTNYHGRPFNSTNDVIYASDGSIWFTDPDYGLEQGFRRSAELPNQIYRFDESTQDIRVMANGLYKPNGLCFSPDEETLYVTDTDWIHGDGSTANTRASHIYAYTVKTINEAPFLVEKRLFAMADTGAPDGIKCDTDGRVYSGCGDGLNIWAFNGSLLGKVVIPGGCANFCFGRPGELFLLNETRIWVLNISTKIQGALLKGNF